MEFKSIEDLYSHIETDLSTLNRELELAGAIQVSTNLVSTARCSNHPASVKQQIKKPTSLPA